MEFFRRHSSLFSLSLHYVKNRIHQSNHARTSVELRNKTKLHLNATNTVFSTVRNFFRAIEIRRTQNGYIVHEEALWEQTAPSLYVINF